MRKVIGYVMCRTTNRLLHNPILYWFSHDGLIQEKIFGTESEGKFEIDVPEYVEKVYVANRGYSVREIKINNVNNQVLVYLNKG